MAEPSVKGAGLRSLDEVFEDEDLTLSFRAFLHSIGSAHYLSLFVEIELLQMMDDADDFQLHSKTHKLYERYLRPGAQQEVHIDESARARLQGALLRPSKRMFVDISAATRIALEQTLLPRYQKSEQFRRLVHEKNLQAHGQLRRPKPADQKTTKEATFTKLFRLIVGKELRDSGDKSVPANRTRTDRADTVALINDMRSQKQAHGAMPSSPTIHSLNHSQGSPERAPSPPSPTLAPSVVKRPGSPPLTSAPTLPSQTASPSPPTAPAPVAASNSGPIVRLERPAPSLLESQYLLMPPLDAEPLPSHPRQERTPTVTAMETPMPPTQSPYASALAQAGLLHSSDSNDLRLHRQLTTPMLMPRADVLGQSLAKEVAVMQAAQAAQAAQTHSAEPAASALPPPVLSQHTFQAARPSHLPHSASSSSLHDARPSPGGGAYALPAPLIVKAHSSTAAPGRDASAPIPTPVSSSSSSSSASGSPTRDRLAVGSPAREPAVVRSSPTLQSRSANLPPPVAPLSLSAGALPARSISKGTHAQLRQGHAFQGATGADQIAPLTPPVALTSPTTKSRLERAKWCAFFEYCGIPPEDAPVAAEQVMAAGIDSSMIGTLSHGLLQGAGLKLGYILRIIKKQREESAPPPQQTTPP